MPPKCTRELQAVTVVDNKNHVDVDVELCYCGEEKCNQERNEAFSIVSDKKVFLLLLISSIKLF